MSTNLQNNIKVTYIRFYMIKEEEKVKIYKNIGRSVKYNDRNYQSMTVTENFMCLLNNNRQLRLIFVNNLNNNNQMWSKVLEFNYDLNIFSGIKMIE